MPLLILGLCWKSGFFLQILPIRIIVVMVKTDEKARYKYYPTRNFANHLARIKHKDPLGYNRIIAVIDRILENPDDTDGVMKGEHHGRFKKYVGRKDYRLIYYYCELCRKPNKMLRNSCEHCEEIENFSVIFFEVYHKKDKKKLKGSGF